MRAMLIVLGAVLALGLVTLADDGSVAWPHGDPGCYSLMYYDDCPPPEVQCGPCMGEYMWCCYYIWYPLGQWIIWCEAYALFCWWNPCDGLIPQSLEVEPL